MPCSESGFAGEFNEASAGRGRAEGSEGAGINCCYRSGMERNREFIAWVGEGSGIGGGRDACGGAALLPAGLSPLVRRVLGLNPVGEDTHDTSMPQVCWSLPGQRLCLLGKGAEPQPSRLLGQQAAAATPKNHTTAGKGSGMAPVSAMYTPSPHSPSLCLFPDQWQRCICPH